MPENILKITFLTRDKINFFVKNRIFEKMKQEVPQTGVLTDG